MKGRFVEVDEEVKESIEEGDIVLLHNTIEFIVCIIAYIHNTNRYIGTIITKLKSTKKYNLADNIEFNRRHILQKVAY